MAITHFLGSQLRDDLEAGARERYFLLAVAGARVTYDYRPGAAARVADVAIGGAPLEPDRRYTVATSEGMARSHHAATGAPYEALPVTIGSVLVGAIRAAGTIRPTLDGRLTIHGTVPGRKPPPESKS